MPTTLANSIALALALAEPALASPRGETSDVKDLLAEVGFALDPFRRQTTEKGSVRPRSNELHRLRQHRAKCYGKLFSDEAVVCATVSALTHDRAAHESNADQGREKVGHHDHHE